MIRHNLLLIFRNFKRFKSVFFINLIGLSTGLMCVLLIYMWVSDELQMDKFHANGDRLYRIMEHRVKADGIWTSPTTSGPIPDDLVAEYPAIEYAIPTSGVNEVTVSIGDDIRKSRGRFAGKEFFNVFSYELIHGNADQVLADKSSVVISESLARNLFKTTKNSIGKTIRFNQQFDLAVSGVFRDIGANSTDKFEFVGSWEHFRSTRDWLTNYGNTYIFTIVLLKPGVDADELSNKIADLVKRKTNNEIVHRTLFLKKYDENYLYGEYENGVLVGGRITYVKLFSIIAVFILLIACVNFMNLSTAKASRRIKEVGIKKTMGANRKALIIQYLGESMLMSFLSLLIAILCVDLILPQFNSITGKQLEFVLDQKLVLSGLAVMTFAGIIAGSYPAFYLSSFSPASVLKNQFNSSLGELWARKGLVVFQFTLSIIFIVSVIVVYNQIQYVESKGLGYDRTNLIYFPRQGDAWKNENLDPYLNELRNIPGVTSVSSYGHSMDGHNGGTYDIQWEGKNPNDKTEFEIANVGFGTIEMLGIEMAEGRAYSRDFAPDTARVILSQAAIKYMGIEDPIGKKITVWGKQVEIIGVSKDFHYESLREGFKPLFLRLAPNNTWRIMVRLEKRKEKKAIADIQKVYERFSPGFVFEYKFLDDSYQSQYVAEQRVATLSKYFAAFAILISCLGLFGLAAFTAERRLKEIGIRKVLGSTELGIIYLLSADFTRIVIIANLIALPAAYFLSKYWLEGFAFHIALEWWFFVSAGLTALGIAWLTVGSQAYKAARVNPTKCLRDE